MEPKSPASLLSLFCRLSCKLSPNFRKVRAGRRIRCRRYRLVYRHFEGNPSLLRHRNPEHIVASIELGSTCNARRRLLRLFPIDSASLTQRLWRCVAPANTARVSAPARTASMPPPNRPVWRKQFQEPHGPLRRRDPSRKWHSAWSQSPLFQARRP